MKSLILLCAIVAASVSAKFIKILKSSQLSVSTIILDAIFLKIVSQNTHYQISEKLNCPRLITMVLIILNRDGFSGVVWGVTNTPNNSVSFERTLPLSG